MTVGEGVRDKHITAGWLQTTCPICGGKHLWLGYNPQKNYFNCFNHGSVTKKELFKAWFPKEDVATILRYLDDSVPVINRSKPKESDHEYLPPCCLHSLVKSKKHVKYVKSRGLDPDELAEKWGVCALDEDTEPRYRNRLFIPVCDSDGVPVSWLTRTIDEDNEYRYLTAPKSRASVPIKNVLFGQQFVTSFDTVIIVEGTFDAFNVGRNVVATLGKKITRAQFNLLKEFQHRILCFDNEPETQAQAKDLCARLSACRGVTENINLDAPDPGSASKKEIESLLKHAGLM